MAATSVTIYCNGIYVRTFGGNKSDVREMRKLYQGMSKDDFLKMHPKFTEICKNKFELIVY